MSRWIVCERGKKENVQAQSSIKKFRPLFRLIYAIINYISLLTYNETRGKLEETRVKYTRILKRDTTNPGNSSRHRKTHH